MKILRARSMKGRYCLRTGRCGIRKGSFKAGTKVVELRIRNIGDRKSQKLKRKILLEDRKVWD